MLDPQVKDFYKDKIEKRAFYTPGVRLEVLRRGADAVFNDRKEIIPIAKWEERMISFDSLRLPDAVPDLKVRIYWPTAEAAKAHEGATALPLVLYFHGGGFVLHNVASHDALTRKIATEWNSVVISADYRLCPENPYPAYLQDAWALLAWAGKHAGELGADPKRIILCGDSAGATISAAISRRLAMRSEGDDIGVTVSEQVLFYGSYGSLPDDESESMRLFGGGDYVLPKTMLDEFTGYTLPPGGIEPDDPFFYPGKGTLPKGMPRSIVVSAECDPLRDDGRTYAKALKAAGCDATYIEAAGMMHGFLLYWHRFEGAEKIIKKVSNIL